MQGRTCARHGHRGASKTHPQALQAAYQGRLCTCAALPCAQYTLVLAAPRPHAPHPPAGASGRSAAPRSACAAPPAAAAAAPAGHARCSGPGPGLGPVGRGAGAGVHEHAGVDAGPLQLQGWGGRGRGAACSTPCPTILILQTAPSARWLVATHTWCASAVLSARPSADLSCGADSRSSSICAPRLSPPADGWLSSGASHCTPTPLAAAPPAPAPAPHAPAFSPYGSLTTK